MKVTKEEIRELILGLETSWRIDINADIRLGIEDDREMVVVILTTTTNEPAKIETHRRIRHLGRKYKEVYYVKTMHPSWFRYYKDKTGFVELQVEPIKPPCPLDFTPFPDGTAQIYWEGKLLGRIRLEDMAGVVKRLKDFYDSVDICVEKGSGPHPLRLTFEQFEEAARNGYGKLYINHEYRATVAVYRVRDWLKEFGIVTSAFDEDEGVTGQS